MTTASVTRTRPVNSAALRAGDPCAPDRIPANLEAEDAVLGSLLIDPDGMTRLSGMLNAEDFYQERHAWIYAALRDLDRQGVPADLVTLCDELERRHQLQEVGGAGYITGLINAVPTAVHLEHYAGLVANTAALRRIIAAAGQIVAAAYDGAHIPQEIAQTGTRMLEAAVAADADKAVLLWENTFDTWNEWQLERACHRDDKKITLPWQSLSFVRPLRSGMLAVVAAESGIGKTTFAENCGDWWARCGFGVAFFHFELAHQIMLDRRMARWSSESMAVIEQGELTAKMQQADEAMKDWKGRMHYIFCNNWPMARVAARARNLVRRGLAQVVIVDYLQKAPLIEHVRGQNPSQMRAYDVETLKDLAESEAVPVMLLAQMNREASKSDRKTRNTIRDTNEAAEKANLVLTLNRKILDADRAFAGVWWEAGSYSPELKVRVDKQTLGGTGEKTLMMNPARYIIADMARTGRDEEERA